MKNINLASHSQLIDIMGMRISKYRNKMGWTQTELARRMKVIQPTIAVWETGKQIPSRENIDKLCALFGIDRFMLEKAPLNS